VKKVFNKSIPATLDYLKKNVDMVELSEPVFKIQEFTEFSFITILFTSILIL